MKKIIFQAVQSSRAMGRAARCRGLFATMVGAMTLTAVGQFTIDWYKVGGGGGTSAGGAYQLTGTIGQHDAGGPMSGGPYSVSGGFWALYAVPTSGAPLLTMFLTPTNTAVVSWPSPSTGFGLLQNSNLAGANWVTPPEPVQDNGVTRFIIVNSPTGNRFYRLKNP